MVAGGSGGILCNISFVALFGKPNLVTTFFVSNRYQISPCLGYDPFCMCSSVVQHGDMSIARIPLSERRYTCVNAMTIVPLKEEEHADSSGAEAETLAGGGRGVRTYPVPNLVCCSVGKIHSCHDCFLQ